MGTCILKPTNLTLNTQTALAGLRKWNLVRDDSNTLFPHRVYRDDKGRIFSSVTHILKETAPQDQKDALERWLNRPSSSNERDIAAKRGTLAHDHQEYVLKTASKLARQSANNKGVWRTGADGLERCPSKITEWAIQKALKSAPRVAWSASGYSRGLRTFLTSGAITAIHAIEFSIHATPKASFHGKSKEIEGWGGTCDCFIDYKNPKTGETVQNVLVDWKTAASQRSEEMYRQFFDQLGAYSIGLTQRTGITANGGIICCARRSGEPTIKYLDRLELIAAEERFIDRFNCYKAQLELNVGMNP